MTSAVLSVEPSSMTMISMFPYVCCKTLLTASLSKAARLYVGMMTLTRGALIVVILEKTLDLLEPARRRERQISFYGHGRGYDAPTASRGLSWRWPHCGTRSASR